MIRPMCQSTTRAFIQQQFSFNYAVPRDACYKYARLESQVFAVTAVFDRYALENRKWVSGSNGSTNTDGSHGSWVSSCDPLTH